MAIKRTDDGPPSARSALIRKSLLASEIIFDEERARQMLWVLYDEFLKSGFSIEENAPQWKYRPSNMEIGSPEHRIWLWSAASTDLRSESEDVYHAHRMLWDGEQDQFAFTDEPRHTRELYTKAVLDWNPQHFADALARRRFGNPHRNVDWWGRRARTLWGEWQGDPFNMFSNGSIDAVMEWKRAQKIDPLPGVGPKIASLIAIFFEEIGMKRVRDAFPVDVHTQRIALALRLVRLTRIAPILNETLESILRPALTALCEDEGWSRITLAHALWFRGNRDCTDCWRKRYVTMTCPVFDDCQGAYASRPYFKMGLWLPEEGPMAKGGLAELVPFHERPLFKGAGE